MYITVVADGHSRTYTADEPLTVEQFLADIEVEVGELDRVNPQKFTQISNGLQITIARVTIEEDCEREVTPYERETQLSENVPPGEEFVSQPGKNGLVENCYRVEITDGVRGQPILISGPNVIEEAVNEIILVAPPNNLDPVEISGTIAYISGGDAWVMRGSSESRRRVTTDGDLDGRVFSLSSSGIQLLFSRTSKTSREFNNQLWYIPDLNAPTAQLIQLRPTNVLQAAWVPGQANTISYSRAEARPSPPGWRAFNDLWLMTIDPNTGEEIRIDPIIEESPGAGGPFNWWGREYHWSPDGQYLAWVQADSIGSVNLETGELTPLLNFPVFAPRGDWSWRTSISWSPDEMMIATTTHGQPYRNEAPERSPIFNIAVTSLDGTVQAELIKQAGIWSIPRFSPYVPQSDSEFPKAYLAYMLARQPLESTSNQAEYDLYIADRDGSNARRLYPPEGRPGILSREYVWSPDGNEIVVVYQGNLNLIDVETGLARQLTLDGNVTRPVLWTR